MVWGVRADRLVGWLAIWLRFSRQMAVRYGSLRPPLGQQLFIFLWPLVALRSVWLASLPTKYRYDGEGPRPDQEFAAVIVQYQKGGRREGGNIMLFSRKIRFIIGFGKPPWHIVVVMWK
ncbi:hypothetical protein EV127DRAFT_9326 [Xylaria flabelliformis]|nr:hypothetical protein EV127DRAFT_9326 [Xylaria flabelliformis]